MNKIIFATNNPHKLEEIRHMAGDQWQIVSLEELGWIEDIPEPHATLEENAVEKAKVISRHFQLPCFADDTGLEVEALQGQPGVLSARYAGDHKSPKDNMKKLLFEMERSSNRKAQFRTVIAFVDGKEVHLFEGIVPGTIIREERGEKGFGYDPVFIPDGYPFTFAEMPLSLKNTLSHRARAMQKFIEFLQQKTK